MNYRHVQEKISQMAKQAGRDPQSITLVAVSKGHAWIPKSQDVYGAGCRHFGESRLQEALPKILESPNDIFWHFIGSLQKNKVSKVIQSFSLIHSVNDLELVEKIAQESQKAQLKTRILLQVNISQELTKQGFSEDALLKHFDTIRSLPHIQIEGLMTMAPLTENHQLIRSCFRRLRLLKEHLSLNHLSMGMSHDYPIAIEEGATLLRLGNAVFSSLPKDP